MDTLTHALLGAVTAQLGFRQKIGRDAAWVAAAAAAAPDLDLLVGPVMTALGINGGNADELVIHRGLTHSLVLAPAIALGLAAVWHWGRAGRRRRRPGQGTAAPFRLLYACVLLAYVSHPLLDFCTSFGTRLLAPLSQARFALDAISVIDIIYTPILALTLAACWLVRKRCLHRVDGRGGPMWPPGRFSAGLEPEAGRPRGAAPTENGRADAGRGPAARATLLVAWAGFTLSLAYLAAGYVMHLHSLDLLSRLAGDAPIVRADAYPAPGTIFLWRGVLQTDRAWTAARVRPLAGVIMKSNTVPVGSGPWVERAMETPEAKRFNWFANGHMRAQVREADGEHIVELHDMRYSVRPEGLESLWPLQIVFDDSGRLITVRRATPGPRGTRWQWIREAWDDLWRS